MPSLDPVWRPRADVGRRIELKEEVHMNAKTNHLTFTAEELAALTLATAKAQAQTGTRARWTVEDRDGAAWAALEVFGLDEYDRQDWLLTFTIQLTSEPGRRFVALASDGRQVIQAGDDLGTLLADLLTAPAEAL